jgi:transcriptional regulator with XRE-family HTH domain
VHSVLKVIGMNIKLARTKQSLSQSELADTLNVEQSYISKLERGMLGASNEVIYEIIHILECKSGDIYPKETDVETKFRKLK